MAQLHPTSWPLQLEGHLNGIKDTFTRLSQELDLTRQQRDEYKAQRLYSVHINFTLAHGLPSRRPSQGT